MLPQVGDQAFKNHWHVSFNEVSLKPEMTAPVMIRIICLHALQHGVARSSV